MPAPYGLTTEGFSRPTVEELRADVQQRIWSKVSPTLDLSDRSLEGQLVGIVVELVVMLWELGEAANGSLDPDYAVDAALDAVCILTGTERRGAYASTVVLTATGDPATPIPTASAARVPGGVQFATLALGMLEAVGAWVAATAYHLGDRVTNDGNVYQCVAAGVSAGAGGPSGEGADIVDSAAHWRYLGEGTAAADLPARASAVGPLVANSGTVTEIVTPTGGWLGVANVLDASVGANQMSNQALRVLRLLELAKPGTGTIDAIEADLLDPSKVPGVKAVTIFNNNTDETVDGQPPHTVEAMVQGGDPQAIWNQLLRSVVAGIRTYGTEVGTATDRRGRQHVQKFTRPTQRQIYVALTVERDPLTFPDDGVELIKDAVVAWGNAQAAGKDAVASRIAAEAFIDDSVIDVAALIGTDPDPSTDTTVDIGLREQAVYDHSRIEIELVDGVP